MFESKRVTREEQVLVIDDAELTGITSSGKDKGFVVNFVMEREGVETHLHVHLSRSHIEAIRDAQVLTVPQLRAVHAKAAKAEEVSDLKRQLRAEVVRREDAESELARREEAESREAAKAED